MSRLYKALYGNRIVRAFAALITAAILGVTAATPTTTLPQGFTETVIATGLAVPTTLAFAPDGRAFVAEKGGLLRIIDAGGNLLPTPLFR